MAPLLIGLLLIGGGASLAAKSALPGSALYGVKTGFNERLRASLSFSDASRAHWDAVLAGRRLKEAESLAAEGKLDADTEARLKARFEAASSDFDKEMVKLDAKNDTSVRAKAAADLGAILSAHQQALVETQANNGSAVSVQSAGDLLGSVNARIGNILSTEAQSDMNASGSSNADSNASLDPNRGMPGAPDNSGYGASASGSSSAGGNIKI